MTANERKWKADRMTRRREGGKDKKWIMERGKMSVVGYTLVTMGMITMIFAADSQRIKLYILNSIIKDREKEPVCAGSMLIIHFSSVLYFLHDMSGYVYECVQLGLR
jgi:hypothetical protein